MKSATLHINKKCVTEGEIVEIRWDAPQSASSRLTIDNGHHSSSQMVTASDSKKFKLNRPGRTHFILTIEQEGKLKSVKTSVRVRKMKLTRATSVDDQGKPLNRWKEKLRQHRNQMRYNWKTYSDGKRLSLRTILFLCILALLHNIAPLLFYIGWGALIIYLARFAQKH